MLTAEEKKMLRGSGDEEALIDKKAVELVAAKPVSMPLKLVVLIALAVQNASHALLSRYSKGILKETYDGSEVVFVAEIIKMIVAGCIACIDTSETDAPGTGANKLMWLLSLANAKKTIVLVVLYGVANLLTFFSLTYIEASLYSVLLQCKTLTTAGFAVVILGRNISHTKWRALCLLVVGCILVASPAYNCATGEDAANSGFFMWLLGVCGVLMICCLSGYAVTYFEQILKQPGERLTIWERNFQLAFYSILTMGVYNIFCGMFLRADAYTVPFQGWSHVTVMVSMTTAAGGLLVAACLKFADAILKTLATAASILISTYLGYVLLGGPLDTVICMGAIVTILSIINFTFDSSPAVTDQKA